MPNPDESTSSARATASTLRRRQRGNYGKPLTPDEIEWLNAYDEAHPRPERGQAVGASRSRKMTHTEEEHEAVGTGEAAAAAAAAGLTQAAADVTAIGTQALVRACGLHEKMAATLLQRAIEDGETIRQLTASVQTHALALAQHQADAIIKDAERAAEESGGDEISKMAAELLPHILKQLKGANVKGP